MSKTATLMNSFRAIATLWVAVDLILIHFFATGEIGYTSHWENGKGYVTAGTHPVFLIWSAVAIVIFLMVLRVRTEEFPAGVASGKRRILAFAIDFWFSLATLSSLGGLLVLMAESARIGKFVWQFQRNYTVPSDEYLGIPIVLSTMVLMVLYFAWPLTKGKQTVGYFIMGMKVTPPFGTSGSFTFWQAIRRVRLAFTGTLSLLSRKADRDSTGRTWYDRETNSTVILIKYEE